MRWAGHVSHVKKEHECNEGFSGKARKKETTRKIQNYVVR
jgi:hypothetical protein